MSFYKDKTKEDRDKNIKNALGIALLDGEVPSEETMELLTEYVDGKLDPDTMVKRIIENHSN